eukprot:SAG22_NODE_10070_length_554_cov_1.545055_2_plen_103_part_01
MGGVPYKVYADREEAWKVTGRKVVLMKNGDRKTVRAMESALRLHQLLPQCDVLLTKSTECVSRLDEIIREIQSIKNEIIRKELSKKEEIVYSDCGPDVQDLLD